MNPILPTNAHAKNSLTRRSPRIQANNHLSHSTLFQSTILLAKYEETIEEHAAECEMAKTKKIVCKEIAKNLGSGWDSFVRWYSGKAHWEDTPDTNVLKTISGACRKSTYESNFNCNSIGKLKAAIAKTPFFASQKLAKVGVVFFKV